MKHEAGPLWLYFISYAIGLAGLIFFVQAFSSPVLVGDKLTFWQPFFLNLTVWDGFTSANGYHCFGIIYFLSSISVANNWQVQTDLYVNVFVIASLPALWYMVIKYRLQRTLIFSDAVIPLIIFSWAPYGTLLLNPHVHVMLPLFMLVFGILLSLPNSRLKLALNIVTIFLATFSAFGYLAAGVFVVALLYKKVVAKRKAHFDFEFISALISFLLALILLVSALPIKADAAINTLTIKWESFVTFKDLIINTFGLANAGPLHFFLPIMLVALIYLLRSSKKKWQDMPVMQRAVFIQFIVSLVLFLVLVGFGRNSYHPNAGLASRYFTTLSFIPLSLYFLVRDQSKMQQVLWLIIGLIVYVAPMKSSIQKAKTISSELNKLETCFNRAQKSKDISKCIDESRQSFYPPNVREAAAPLMLTLKKDKKGQFAK